MEKIIQKIKELTGKNFIKLADSGDHSIKSIAKLMKSLGKDRVLLQDQGGWLTYQAYTRKHGLMTIELKTDYGLVDLDDLAKKANNNGFLLINSLTGYFAEQPMHEIVQMCSKTSCLLINDVSGSIGTENAKIGDIIFGSFGQQKPINLGYGGFIATDNEDWFKKLEGCNFKENKLIALERELERMPKRLQVFTDLNKKIKQDLKNYKIIHLESYGINVVVKFDSEQEKKEIMDYCEANKLEFTLCPRYIRILDNAISIEVKRFNVAYD